MKKIFIIIRIDSYLKTKQALSTIGVSGLNAHVVQGRGKKSMPSVVDSDAKGNNIVNEGMLLPKKLIEIVAEDDLVDDIVKVVIEANKTGNSGDGKIFIMPVTDVFKIRTKTHEL